MRVRECSRRQATEVSAMKLLGGNDDGGGRGRSQDDAAVGYVFQRHPHEPEFPHFAHKQPRWATGEDAINDVSYICVQLNQRQLDFRFWLNCLLANFNLRFGWKSNRI